jgi:X-X-X-Leu-X-X-Gly heptad repeat protein
MTFGPRQSPRLPAGSKRLVAGSTRLLAGSKRLVAGSTRLLAGSKRLVSGSTRLLAGSTRLLAGSKRLVAGSTRLLAGSTRLLAGSTNHLTDPQIDIRTTNGHRSVSWTGPSKNTTPETDTSTRTTYRPLLVTARVDSNHIVHQGTPTPNRKSTNGATKHDACQRPGKE